MPPQGPSSISMPRADERTEAAEPGPRLLHAVGAFTLPCCAGVLSGRCSVSASCLARDPGTLTEAPTLGLGLAHQFLPFILGFPT